MGNHAHDNRRRRQKRRAAHERRLAARSSREVLAAVCRRMQRHLGQAKRCWRREVYRIVRDLAATRFPGLSVPRVYFSPAGLPAATPERAAALDRALARAIFGGA